MADLLKIHKLSSNHMNFIDDDTELGCFFCLETFFGEDVTEIIDSNKTCLCPECSVDSVLPLSEAFIEYGSYDSTSLLRDMHEEFFSLSKINQESLDQSLFGMNLQVLRYFGAEINIKPFDEALEYKDGFLAILYILEHHPTFNNVKYCFQALKKIGQDVYSAVALSEVTSSKNLDNGYRRLAALLSVASEYSDPQERLSWRALDAGLSRLPVIFGPRSAPREPIDLWIGQSKKHCRYSSLKVLLPNSLLITLG